MILNKRVFLKLDNTGLHYKDIELRSRLLGMLFPRNNGIFVSWDNIESTYLKHSVLTGDKIELTLKTKKNDNNIKQNVNIVCSQDNAENILKSIRLFMEKS